MQKQLYALFLVLLFALPLVVYKTNAESPFELPRLAFTTFVTFLIFFIYILKSAQNQIIKIRYSLPLLFLTGTLISTLISYSISVNPYLSMWGNKLLPSDSVWSVLVIYSLSFIVLQSIDKLADYHKMLYVLVAILSLQIAMGLVQVFRLDPFWWANSKMIFGTIGMTIAYATLIAFINPTLLYLYFYIKKRSSKIVLIIIFLLSNYIILHSGSRTPIFANLLAIFALIFFYFFKRPANISRKELIAPLIAIFCAFLFFEYDGTNKELNKKTSADYLSHSAGIRYELTQNALSVWKEKPLFGHGPETFLITQLPYQSPQMNKSHWKYDWVKAHNQLSQMLATTGILGFSFLILNFIYVVFFCFKLLFAKKVSENETLAYALGCSYGVLFVTNLTCFTVVPTQIFYYITPLLFANLLDGQIKNIELNLKKSVRASIALISTVGFLYLTYKSTLHWYSDSIYQEARRLKIVEIKNTAAIDNLERASELNSSEPYYYCVKAITLGEMLIHNHKKISPAVIKNTLTFIDEAANSCVTLSINRQHPINLVAQTYSELFFQNIITNANRGIELYTYTQKLAPKNPEIYFKLGVIYHQVKDFEKYKESMNKAISVKDDYLLAYISLFEYHYSKNETEKVAELLQNVLKITFTSADFINSINTLASIAENYKDSKTQNELKQFYVKNKHLIDL